MADETVTSFGGFSITETATVPGAPPVGSYRATSSSWADDRCGEYSGDRHLSLRGAILGDADDAWGDLDLDAVGAPEAAEGAE